MSSVCTYTYVCYSHHGSFNQLCEIPRGRWQFKTVPVGWNWISLPGVEFFGTWCNVNPSVSCGEQACLRKKKDCNSNHNMFIFLATRTWWIVTTLCPWVRNPPLRKQHLRWYSQIHSKLFSYFHWKNRVQWMFFYAVTATPNIFKLVIAPQQTIPISPKYEPFVN